MHYAYQQSRRHQKLTESEFPPRFLELTFLTSFITLGAAWDSTAVLHGCIFTPCYAAISATALWLNPAMTRLLLWRPVEVVLYCPDCFEEPFDFLVTDRQGMPTRPRRFVHHGLSLALGADGGSVITHRLGATHCPRSAHTIIVLEAVSSRGVLGYCSLL